MWPRLKGAQPNLPRRLLPPVDGLAEVATGWTSFDVAALEGARNTAPDLPRGLLLDKPQADWLDPWPAGNSGARP